MMSRLVRQNAVQIAQPGYGAAVVSSIVQSYKGGLVTAWLHVSDTRHVVNFGFDFDEDQGRDAALSACDEFIKEIAALRAAMVAAYEEGDG